MSEPISLVTSPQPQVTLRLRCLIEGEDAVFTVTVSVNDEIGDLKKLIKKEREQSILRDVDPNILVLWKVRRLESIVSFRLTFMILQVEIALNDQDRTPLSNLAIDEGDEGVQKLAEWKPVSEYWKTQPSADILSVFVKYPATGELSSSPVDIYIADVVRYSSDPDVIVSPATLVARPAPPLISFCSPIYRYSRQRSAFLNAIVLISFVLFPIRFQT